MEEMGWWTLGTGILENKDLSSAPFVSCLSLKAQEGSIGEANVLHAEGARINPSHLQVGLRRFLNETLESHSYCRQY